MLNGWFADVLWFIRGIDMKYLLELRPPRFSDPWVVMDLLCPLPRVPDVSLLAPLRVALPAVRPAVDGSDCARGLQGLPADSAPEAGRMVHLSGPQDAVLGGTQEAPLADRAVLVEGGPVLRAEEAVVVAHKVSADQELVAHAAPEVLDMEIHLRVLDEVIRNDFPAAPTLPVLDLRKTVLAR